MKKLFAPKKKFATQVNGINDDPAERKQALGKEWHPQCFKCVECGRFLDPGRLLEHDDKPYCNHCYKNLFGPDGFRAGTSQPQRVIPQFANMGEPLTAQQKSDILSKLKEYNIYKEKMSEHLRHREVNDRIFFEGVLKIYWGLKRPITVAPRKNIGGRKSTFRDSSLNFVSIDDESFGAILENATERFIETMGERDGDGDDDDDDDDEEDGKVTQSLSNASLARARINSVPIDLAGHMERGQDDDTLREEDSSSSEEAPIRRISRGSRSRVVLRQKSETRPRDNNVMVRRRSASFRKVLKHRKETEALEEKRSKFIPPYGNPTHLRVSNIQKVAEVINMLLQKYHVENDQSDFVLMVMHDNGASELLAPDDNPLKTRLKLGPSEDVAKLYIIEAQDADRVGVSHETAEYIKFQVPELQLFLKKYNEEEQRERDKIVRKFTIFRGAVQQQINASSGKSQGVTNGQIETDI